jgi:hypothetical protein
MSALNGVVLGRRCEMKLLVKDSSMTPPPISITHKRYKPTKSHSVAQIKKYQEHYNRVNKLLQINEHRGIASVGVY